MTVTTKEKTDIKRQGYAITGGLPRNTYWTPDGRRIEAIPSMRTFNQKDEEGNVIGSGTRDANLDKGWLLAPPSDPKPYCAGCDNWHDTEEEVTLCIAMKEVETKKWEDHARSQRASQDASQGKEIENLKDDMLEMKGMIFQLLNKEKD